ncbi:MAG: cysteine hydrolase [Armatimonadetes bacterium]|nr:cysteine hydrolase [Armatimonadota bacterium]
MQAQTENELTASAHEFLDWLSDWQSNLEDMSLEQIALASGGPERIGVFCVDMINGFCYEGALASPRVEAIASRVADLFTRVYEVGVRTFILPQDAHPADSPEFASWPPHCVAGTSEADTIEPLRSLPFAELFQIIPKYSTNPSPNTAFDATVHEANLHTAICVGDCTDLCVYQLATHLRTGANAAGEKMDVIVPADCVQTYDLSVQTARQLGALPHPGDLMHTVFLYHLALNGVRVVRSIIE